MPTRLTPALASALRALRKGSVEVTQSLSSLTYTAYYVKQRFAIRRTIAGSYVSDQTYYKLMELSEWVTRDGLLTEAGWKVYVDGNGNVHHLASSDAVAAQYKADAERSNALSMAKFAKGFPRCYLSPSINQKWKCEDYETFQSLCDGRLVCPKTGEPMLEIPKPPDEAGWDECLLMHEYKDANR
jgi:hypothetical protein